MILYQSKIEPLDYEEKYGNVTTRNELICGNLQAPVADLKADDYDEDRDSQVYFEKNLKSVMVVDTDTDCVMQIYRNDLVDPKRNTYPISYTLPEGFKLIGVDQHIVANKFWISDNEIDIIGREFPEIYSQETCLMKVYGKAENGDYVETRFTIAEDGKSIVCSEKIHPADKQYAKTVLSRKTYTRFIRAFGGDKFINKVKVPPKTRIFVNPAALTKCTLDKFLKRYFPGGFSETEERHAESWEFNPSNLESVIDTIIQDPDHPVFQIYFLGYTFDQTKELRVIADKGFENRRNTMKHERAKKTGSKKHDSKKSE